MSEMTVEKQDLTTGPLGKKILLFSLPLMISNLLQVLFNMADRSEERRVGKEV